MQEGAAAGRRRAQAAGDALVVGQEDGEGHRRGRLEPFAPGRVVVAVDVHVPAGRAVVAGQAGRPGGGRQEAVEQGRRRAGAGRG
ncbi:hypothetical protein ACFSTC_18515 [Nonomuraea ferruginea]